MNKKSNQITNIEVVLYALYKLDGATKKIHTELIAWESFQLAEEKFSWSLPEFRKKKFPDKTTARYALEQAKKDKLVAGRAGKDKSGSESEGWLFTPTGVDWIVNNEKRLKKLLNEYTPIAKGIPEHKALRFIKKIKSKGIFKDYQINNNLQSSTIYDFLDLIECSPDASRKLIIEQFDSIKNTINLINDRGLKNLVRECETKFSNYLTHE